ncbi:MAG: prohead core scaffolding protein and protease [Culicoidibacterales bacterium]
MKEELLIESWGVPHASQNATESLVESVERDGNLYIEGIFLQANIPNGNGRIYPKSVLEKAVTKYIQEQVNTKQALGELNHPTRANPDPLHAAIIIEKLWWQGDNVHGKARVLTGDGAEGDKVASLIRAGWTPGVSSRGLGSVKRNSRGLNEVQEGYRLTVGVDVVWGPSAPNAYVKPYYESLDESAVQVKAIANADDDKFSRLTENLSKISV